ncbi:GEVED domain-containing protein [Aequorivita viscosa]|uniref:Por secretion system C-terminal sorting domain-containing protein n=1 Tax=Aequorivita viscosa TaxID=797419 RepID=A0A1M6NTE0_9FLAO|nr:GEVED domain-containing protein [Aequorivita viscosa]SDX36165.1 Por secretion system C-terminal sorting domain-containing protein [Aequorivita viscosa]SHJ98898.1 Por secretion system C-terminal sorting domain-containing protein [Aequorivita viscosa]
MKKTVFFLLALFMISLSWQGQAQSYCTPSMGGYGVEPITSVVFAGINNTSSASTSSPGYEDFTSLTPAEISVGDSPSITLKGNADGPYGNFYTVFIDWNQNGILDDAGEMYQLGYIVGSTGTDNISLTGVIAVPPTALAGNTRMRVIKDYYYEPGDEPEDPCGDYDYGQAEDYTVNVSIPTCLAVTNVAATITSLTAATISWTASSPAPSNGYEYALTTSSTPPASGTSTSATSVSGVALYQSVNNYVHVRSNCGLNGFSSWTTYTFMGPTPGQIGELELAANLPINSCNNFNYSQQLYFADELDVATDGGGNYISKIRFYYQTAPTSTANWNNWTVYMANTTKTEFTSATDWVAGSELTQVFSGALNIPAAGNWMEITLNPGFMWDGTSNLVIAIDENVSGYNCTAAFGAFNDPSEVGRTLLHTSDPVNADPNAPPAATGWYLTVNTLQLEVGTPPSCLSPLALTADAIAATTADVSWTAGDTETAWNISWGTPGYTPGDGDLGTASVGTTTYQITGLTASTRYDVYIQANCGGDVSDWVGPVSFTTTQIPAVLPYLDDFSTNQFSFVNGTQTNKWAYGTAAGNPGSSIYISNDNGTTNAYTTNASSVTQAYRDISIPSDATSAEFSFDWQATGEGTTYKYDYLRVWMVPTSFSPTAGSQITAAADRIKVGSDFNLGSGWTTYQNTTLDLSTFAGQTMRLVFEWRNDSSGGAQPPAAIDNISLEIPTCPAPLDLMVDAVTTTTADVSWTDQASTSAYDVKYGTPGFDPSTEGTMVPGNATGATLTGLTANTSYQFYARAKCGVGIGGSTSSWAGPITFKTACGAVAAMFENFDSYATGNIVPDCWERMVPATSAGSQSISSTSPASGNRNIYQYTSSTSNSVIVALPLFSNVNAGTHWLKLKARVGSGTGTLSVGYVTDVSDYNSFTLIEDVTITNTSYASNSEYTVVIPNTVPAGARLGIKSAANGTSHYWDDVSWEQVPSCFEPTALVATGVTETTVDIDWTAGNTESSWNISWGTPGYTPGDVNEIATAITSVTNYQITGLTAETEYDVYVQSDCESDGTSDWVGPLGIYTGYCIPTTTSDLGHIGSVTITGDLGQDISNLDSGPGLDGSGYSDFSTQTVMVTPESDITYSVTIASGTTGLKIWIDWNNDLMFDETTELVYQTSSYSGSHSGSITMPAAAGSYRMRIGSSYTPSTGPANACGHTGSGEFEDYTIEIVQLATCTEAIAGTVVGSTTMEVCALAPFSMSVTGNSEPADGLTRTWQSSPAGAGTWTDLDVASSTINIDSGIDTATDYRYHVECINGDTDDSAIISVSINPDATACYCIPEGTNSARFIDNFATTDGIQNISNLGSGFSTGGYGDFTAMTLEANAGDELNFTSGIVGGSAGFRIWVDWNQDGAFDTIEEVAYQSSGYNTAHVGSFTIPFDAATGQTRMRIVSHWLSLSGDVDPCETGFSYGEFEDYTVIINAVPGFVYNNGAWSPSDPNTNATATDDITVVDGVTSFTADIEVNNITVMSGATLNVESVLTFNGDLTIDGDLVFVSTATGNGELAAVNGTSTITGNATVQRYAQNKRSYRMVSSAVTTTTSIHDNWQEGAANSTDNPSPGFGTHITGSTTGQNGFDATATGNASMFTVDVSTQQFQAIANTDVNTLTAGDAYLLFVRGDRSIDLTDPTDNVSSETVLRATGALVTGTNTQNFASATAGNFVMFGNPYQSAVDVNSVFASSTNVNSNFLYVYDPSLGTYGSYVTVDLPSGTSGSTANQYLQPGQAAQVQVTGPATIIFNESDKAPGNFTSTNASPMMENDMLTVQLFTTENFNNHGAEHDSFRILFGEGNDNRLTLADAVKPMNFYENLGRDLNGTFLSIERRALPESAEVYPLYSAGYQANDYTLKLTVDGLEGSFLYLDDHFTGTSMLLEAGENTYSFRVDANDALSIATDRFSIRTEQRLGVDDNSLLAGIRLFPNPLNGDTFYINAPKLNGEQLAVSISDLTGRNIFEQTIDCRANTVTIPMGDNVASGVYLVTLKHGGDSNTYRLIKE